jgi:hypothetical protein
MLLNGFWKGVYGMRMRVERMTLAFFAIAFSNSASAQPASLTNKPFNGVSVAYKKQIVIVASR